LRSPGRHLSCEAATAVAEPRGPARTALDGGAPRCDSAVVAPTPDPVAADSVSWYDVPGVRLLGAVLGTLLLVAAIRAMFGRRR
jgi:hypothetical protein